MNKRKEIISIVVGFLGSVLGLYGVLSFSRFVLMSLSLVPRRINMILVYWLAALIPIIVMVVNKDKLSDYGFTRDKIGLQIIIGIALGIAMSMAFTLIPHLFGFGIYVDNGKRYQYIWQFIYEFIYCIIAIGFVEEYVFRGFIYKKAERISKNKIIPIAVSSILFGMFHLFNGNIAQIIMTALIGAFFCFCRLKIKNCTIVSLIIAHGIYDALISLWASILL